MRPLSDVQKQLWSPCATMGWPVCPSHARLCRSFYAVWNLGQLHPGAHPHCPVNPPAPALSRWGSSGRQPTCLGPGPLMASRLWPQCWPLG